MADAVQSHHQGSSEKTIQSLTENLNDFLQYAATPRRKEIKRSHERIIRRAVNPILREIGSFDDRFYVEPIDANHANANGCYVEQVTRADEFSFDVLIILPNILTPKTLNKKKEFTSTKTFIDTRACDNPYVNSLPGFGYVVIDPNATFLHDLLSERYDCVSSEVLTNFESHAYLSPEKVLHEFGQLIKQAVNKMEEECWWEREPVIYQVDVEKQGPAITLTFLLGGETFTVSLLMALKFTGWSKSIMDWGLSRACNAWLTQERIALIKQELYVFAAKPPEEEDASRLWCICFYPLENTIAATADKGSHESCRKKSFHAIEAIYEENSTDFQPITPRIIKTLFLHQCIQFPHDDDWQEKCLGRAFVDLFLALIKSLKQAKCQHFFLKEQNLLCKEEKWDLKPIVTHLKAILNDIIQNPDRTAFLPVPARIRKLRKAEKKSHTK